MQVINDNLVRMKELAEQAATGSYSAAQRAIMNAEFGEMADEIDRIAGATRFNGITMLNTSTGTVSIHVGTSTTIDVQKVNMTKSGLGINTGVEVDQVTFLTAVSSPTEEYVTVTDHSVDLTVQFENDGTTEDEITVTLDVGSYSVAALVSAFNEQSEALGFQPDGTDKSYEMASAYENADGAYQLRLASRLEADAITSFVVASTETDNHGTISGWGGAAVTSTNAGTAINDGTHYDESQVTGGINIATTTAAAAALDTISAAINVKEQARAAFGYKMNHLEKTIAILEIQSENLMTAESRISDVDVATEMATLTRSQVLSMAAVNMLSQASEMPRMALSLLS